MGRARQRWWASVAALLLCLGAAAAARALRVRATARYLETRTYADIYYLPPPRWLPALSLGYREAAADLLWMRALVYFGTEVQHRGAVRYVYQYGDAILALDPGFRRAYQWIGMAGIYRPRRAGVEAYERAIGYLRRGVQQFPDDGELAWDLGATIMYELLPQLSGQAHRAQREALRSEAVTYMETAARLGAGPPYLGLVNASELARLGELDAARRHLEEIYDTVRDPGTRQQIAVRLQQLSDEASARAFTAAAQALDARHDRDFPYIPMGLYVLVGARPPVDEAGLLSRRFMPAEAVVEASSAGALE